MGSTLVFQGDITATPTQSQSAQSLLPAELYAIIPLAKKSYGEFILTDSTVTAVPLGGLTEVHVLCVQTNAGKVRLRITTADGATQAIPVDPVYVQITSSVPITALDITRDTTISNAVTVSVLMGQKET